MNISKQGGMAKVSTQTSYLLMALGKEDSNLSTEWVVSVPAPVQLSITNSMYCKREKVDGVWRTVISADWLQILRAHVAVRQKRVGQPCTAAGLRRCNGMAIE